MEEVHRIAEKIKEDAARDKGARNAKEFRRLLKCRFGNLHRAWNEGLDLDGNGRLSYNEFSYAVRMLGFRGAVLKLWVELDGPADGYVFSNSELERIFLVF